MLEQLSLLPKNVLVTFITSSASEAQSLALEIQHLSK